MGAISYSLVSLLRLYYNEFDDSLMITSWRDAAALATRSNQRTSPRLAGVPSEGAAALMILGAKQPRIIKLRIIEHNQRRNSGEELLRS